MATRKTESSLWSMIRGEFVKQHTDKANPLTYEALAEKAGLPLMTVYDALSGKRATPSIDRAEAIAKALGLTLGFARK